MTDTKTLVKQENVKESSGYLRGDILEELRDETTIAVSEESYELLKFHGTYQGYNRDTATERKKQKLDKEYEFMIRLRIPAGGLTAKQYLWIDDIAEKYANATTRITSRETFQLHCITKDNLWQTMHEIDAGGLTTFGGCGDIVRNVTCSNAPIASSIYDRLRDDTLKISDFTAGKTNSYVEIWRDGKQVNAPEDKEPLYGNTYLPRKFKVGLITPEDNATDVFVHDIGLVLIHEGDTLKGYNVVLGGGMGMDHEGKLTWSEKKTYPRLADPVAFVGLDDAIPAVEAAVKMHRDFGDRTNRKHARLKYQVAERGLDWATQTFAEYFNQAGGKTLSEPVAIDNYQVKDHMGWHEQGDGKLYLGIPVPSGRIMDYSQKDHPSKYTDNVNDLYKNANYRSALREVAEQYGFPLRLTATEELILCDIDPAQKDEINQLFKKHGCIMAEDLTPAALHLMACVALPTCAKALADSERVQFPILDDIQDKLDKHGLRNEHLSIRITGCPNGCARPYIGDIGIVGRMPGHYVIHIGGDFAGTRLNVRVFDKVPEAEIGMALEPMFATFAKERLANETFGDFAHRYGEHKLAQVAADQLDTKWAEVIE